MNKDTIAAAVAGRLYAAETAIDLALAETAALLAMMPGARAGAHLSAVTGQRALDRTNASISALVQARGHLVETHNTLAALARKMGLDTLAVGPMDKPEDTPPIGSGPKVTGVLVVNKLLPKSEHIC